MPKLATSIRHQPWCDSSRHDLVTDPDNGTEEFPCCSGLVQVGPAAAWLEQPAVGRRNQQPALGFDGIETLAVTEWNQLAIAVERLIEQATEPVARVRRSRRRVDAA